MAILLAFAPFIVFAVVDRLAGTTDGLLAAVAVSAVLLIRDWMRHRRSPKVLEIGTFLLFSALALYALLGGPTGSLFAMRLAVDGGLLLIVLASIAIRRPFTLQYARERAPREYWDHPAFVRTNYVITYVWALAFVVLVLADIVLACFPDVPSRFGIVATILALVGAVKFTSWYPERQRAKATRAAGR